METKKVSVTEKNKFEKMIQVRKSSILNALDNELTASPDVISHRLRVEKNVEKNITLTREQAEAMLTDARKELAQIIQDNIRTEKSRVEIAIAELDDEMTEQEKEMKDRHREEWEELQNTRKEGKKKLRNELADCEKRITKEHGYQIAKNIADLEIQRRKIIESEMSINRDTELRIAAIKKNKQRLESAINDAANRAIETLWTTEDPAVCADLINKIPTITEAINACATPEGFMSLFKRLDSTLALPCFTEKETKEAEPHNNTEVVKEIIIDTTVTDSVIPEEQSENHFNDFDHQREVYQQR